MMEVPAILFAFTAALGYSCLDAIAAYNVNIIGMSLFQFMGFRNTMASLFLLSYLLASGTAHAPLGPPGIRTLLWTRGLLMTITLVLVYTSMRYLTLSEFWMINSCSPFPTAILCWFILKEKFTRIQGVCCLLSIAGVLLITNPLAQTTSEHGGGQSEDHLPKDPISKLVGIAFGVPSIILIGLEVVIMRIMGEEVEHPQILASLAIVPAVISAM